MGPAAEFAAATSRAAAWLRPTRWSSGVPLAWRNAVADERHLLRSTSGIAFAVVLMLLQLGFRGAFVDSALEVIKGINGDLVLISATKYRFGSKDPFSRRQLYAARAIEGVEWARPIYGEWTDSFWKNPQTQKNYNIQVLAFDPDQPVFSFPEIRGREWELRRPDTAFSDSRARPFHGAAHTGTVTELSRHEIHIIDTFRLGPNFTTDGTLITSDRTFMKFFARHTLDQKELADVEFGVIKVRPGYAIESVKHAIQQRLPVNVAVLSKPELLSLEMAFQNIVSPVGPIFLIGTAIGFVVGMTICYQILYTDLSDNLTQYATLKAIGYVDGYLVRIVLVQACLYALLGFVPALVISIGLYDIIGETALLPLRMTFGNAIGVLALTVGMCMVSGLLAVRQVLAADPAEVF